MQERPSHTIAVLQALLVTFLWSTSWVLIKIGLRDIPALTFAGLRYCLATALLLPLMARAARGGALQRFTKRDWARLGLLGLLFYAVTQGAVFVGLSLLPALTVSLILNFTSPLVALLGVFALAERPSLVQWGGVGIFLVGAMTYFYPASFPAGQSLGVLVVLGGLLANSLSSILGRAINRSGRVDPVIVTVVSMGSGAIILLVSGLLTQGLLPLRLTHWAIIGWLAAVNTAFGFTLWNYTLRSVSAMESSIINGTMLVQIGLLAWLFMGETITWRGAAGMDLAGSGAVMAQLRPMASEPHSA